MSVIEEAIRLVHGARQNSYGHPYDDFSRTGRLWGAILGIDPVPPHLVALCMIAVKVSREVNAPKADNLIDIAGYAEALALVREREGVTESTVTTVTAPRISTSTSISTTASVSELANASSQSRAREGCCNQVRIFPDGSVRYCVLGPRHTERDFEHLWLCDAGLPGDEMCGLIAEHDGDHHPFFA